MKYKKTKNAQKPKSSCSISSDLITGNRFGEIVKILDEKSELNNQDRYLYGYSLLRTQQKLQSLITLWPLAAKGHATLTEDCAYIAADIFKDENAFSSAQLSEEALNTLFLAGRSLAPNSPIYHSFKKRFLDSLWQKGDHEKLERILKSSKEEFSVIYVENLSKLAFLQPEKKLIGNISAFVSYVLTGAAGLIARNPIYHNDIADEIHLLANEIKLLYSQLKTQNKQGLNWDQSTLNSFVDYEANILIEVLQLVVKKSDSNLDIIPTPNYLLTYDATTKRVSQKFLPWLAIENKELFELYSADTYRAALWALGGEKSININSIAKSVQQDKLHPYLRLAIMFRAINIKNSSLKGLVQISDIENTKESTGIFRNLLIQTVCSMIDEEPKIKLPPEFWKLLLEFKPALPVSEFKNALLKKTICTLHQQYKDETSLDLEGAKDVAHLLNAHEFAKEIEVLRSRQEVCLQFLQELEGEDEDEFEKKSKAIINNIKDEPALRTHLTLLADAYILSATDLSGEFYQHFNYFLGNKKINKLIPLQDLFDCDSDCDCLMCEMNDYTFEIIEIAEKLNLPIVQLPDIDLYSNLQSTSKSQIPKSSILSEIDPFKIIDVSLSDSKPVIMQKVMKLIQEKPEQMAVFRKAQNELFNPAQRFLHHYFRYLAEEDSNIEAQVESSSISANLATHEIPLRQEFLNEK